MSPNGNHPPRRDDQQTETSMPLLSPTTVTPAAR